MKYSKELKQRWLKGDIDLECFLYLKFPNGVIDIVKVIESYKYTQVWDKNEIKVLGIVPSYDDFVILLEVIARMDRNIAKLEDKLHRLKRGIVTKKEYHKYVNKMIKEKSDD